MQNMKHFLIAFAAGIVLFGFFAFAIPGLLLGNDDENEEPAVTVSGNNQSEDVEEETELANEENKSFTAVVCGYDEFNGELDAVVFIKADKENERFIIASLPTYLRVMLTGVDAATGESINSFVRLKDFTDVFLGEESKRMLLDTVNAITGMKVDYYAFFNTSSFVKLFEKTGGIYYTVPQDMYYVGIGTPEKPEINLKAGGQVLGGKKILQLLRFASYSENPSVNQRKRAEVQADFAAEAMKQILKSDAVKLIDGISGVLAECDTNFTAVDFKNNFNLIASFPEYASSSVVMSLDVSDPIDYTYSQKLFENYK